tara:strand:- start:695 stop:823 length:129 start_codon:yes stop_codon:yes gene_type:complete
MNTWSFLVTLPMDCLDKSKTTEAADRDDQQRFFDPAHLAFHL